MNVELRQLKVELWPKQITLLGQLIDKEQDALSDRLKKVQLQNASFGTETGQELVIKQHKDDLREIVIALRAAKLKEAKP